MKETTSHQVSSASPGCYPPGPRHDGPPAEEENGEMEADGILTAEMVSSCVSNLGNFGTGLQHCYNNLSLPSYNLSDISVLCSYVHLKRLELPHNKIKDLSCVSHMSYLVTLDASHNEISNFFGFQPPKNLKEVNFSHNLMTKMADLSPYASLCKLDLGYNSFSAISGLEECCSLTHLNLEHNKIVRISSLDNLPLVNLCLRGNRLKKIEGLENLKSLQVLDLSVNSIDCLSGFQNLDFLGTINLEKNLISEIEECKHIHNISLLRDLKLQGNPVQEQPHYRLAVIFLLQHLTMLDGEKVTAEEKVSSVNKYDPPLDVLAARDHMTHTVNQLMQPQVVYDSTLPNADSPYPMLVLTGPQACGKRELAHRLCQDFSEYFAYGTCHTTRGPYFGEENGLDYHFVTNEDFQNMVHMGRFIQTMDYGGHRYGLSRDAIEDVAREGLACCVHMELEGVFSLKKTYFEPRYILLIPTQVEKYTNHLKGRDLYTPAQIDMAVSRVELYANTNRQQPGFFDNVISCDDWEEAYQTLKQVVNDYLLLEELEEGEISNRATPDNISTGHEVQENPPSPLLGSGSGAAPRALEPSDLSHRSYFNKIQAELSPQKSPTELASIRRRERLVREAIMGRSPGVYSQLSKSSLDESHGSSALSLPGSARASSVLFEPPSSSVLGPALDSHKASYQTPGAQCPITDPLATATPPSSDRRPGSNVRTILPPIPTGRKTPVAPSPAPSGVADGRDSDREV
ncbi:leucine-rich repeat and guanylate kinase domain-containing protein [Antennarius striatus]|uniref:leucine-rich repeat and guanylate kinase domain-containing protein n=1 Tax=Antennarius striatus TaxID=241820 RepID=UPI0035AF17BA